jgi:hypothetical protein
MSINKLSVARCRGAVASLDPATRAGEFVDEIFKVGDYGRHTVPHSHIIFDAGVVAIN